MTYRSRHAEHDSGIGCWCIPTAGEDGRVTHRVGSSDLVALQTSVGMPHWRYAGSPRWNTNPIHVGVSFKVRMALDPTVWSPTFCGVGAHSYAYDKDGVRVETFDPDHPQSCRVCARRYRALQPIKVEVSR